jgi:hypothetical protein
MAGTLYGRGLTSPTGSAHARPPAARRVPAVAWPAEEAAMPESTNRFSEPRRAEDRRGRQQY